MPIISKPPPQKTKILFLTTELKPFLSLSSTASLLKQLILAVDKTQEYEIRVIMPKFGLINERTCSLHEVQRLSGINITVEHEEVSLVVKVGSLKPSKVQVYFLDNEYLFDRKGYFHNTKGKFYDDNHNRLVFINKSVLAVLSYLRWNPQIVHAFGWPWSLLPLYAKTHKKSTVALRKAKYIYTHNDLHFEPKIDPKVLEEATDLEVSTPPSLETLTQLTKIHADTFTTLPKANPLDPEALQAQHENLIQEYFQIYSACFPTEDPTPTSS